MQDELKQLWLAAQAEIAAADPADHTTLKVKYLGRKSHLNQLLGEVKGLPVAERSAAGQLGNQIKAQLLHLLEDLASRQVSAPEHFDPTIPGRRSSLGRLHPITQTTDQLVELFTGMGFSIAEGPEVETEAYNFDLLNIPDNHPARDAWDTFWVKPSKAAEARTLLRTHTSPVQIRYMLEHKPPLRVIAPGRVFRYEAEDATHGSVFFQLEGLVVDKHITVGHLKAVISELVKGILGDKVQTRLRPSFFPFTEPSFEVDIWFKGKWLELMGCGMVHPQVLTNVHIDPAVYSGFAFGLGIDRIAMLKHDIHDLRLFYSGNLDFLEQF